MNPLSLASHISPQNLMKEIYNVLYLCRHTVIGSLFHHHAIVFLHLTVMAMDVFVCMMIVRNVIQFTFYNLIFS